jgi:hypothetical protein
MGQRLTPLRMHRDKYLKKPILLSLDNRVGKQATEPNSMVY